jgi:uncharacterized protein (TIGR00288 family)
MAHTITSMALFCDFENIALGVRDAKYAKFDIDRVLERLLLKGSIVVKKAYCDWERYREFKAPMHEGVVRDDRDPARAHVGKNSADIRMVVDALDLCYTKEHVDTFVIISGDSDFSPLVSKLRENNKFVIGVGVKSSTSDLLIANCDEFIYYDDLVRQEERKKQQRTRRKPAKPAPKPPGNTSRRRRRAKRTASRKRSTCCSTRSTRSPRSATRTRRSGARWSSRRSSAAIRVQRELLRLPHFQRSAGRSAEPQAPDARARPEVRRLRHQESHGVNSRSAISGR